MRVYENTEAYRRVQTCMCVYIYELKPVNTDVTLSFSYGPHDF